MIRALTKEEAEYLVDTNKRNNNQAWWNSYNSPDTGVGYIVRVSIRNGQVWVIDGREVLSSNTGFNGGWQMRYEKAEDIKYPMSEPEFDLDDMELAEIIMEELK